MVVRRILFVDDEDDIRAVGVIALEAVGGLQVMAAASGKEALRVAADFRPDLVVLDVMMPELDGPATLAALRALDGVGQVPVLFLTAKVQPTEVERYKQLGAIGIIAKPFDPMTLAAEIQSAVAAAGTL